MKELNELISKYEKEKADAISEIKKCQDERDTEAEEYYIGQKSAFTSILNDLKQLSIALSARVRKDDLIALLKSVVFSYETTGGIMPQEMIKIKEAIKLFGEQGD